MYLALLSTFIIVAWPLLVSALCLSAYRYLNGKRRGALRAVIWLSGINYLLVFPLIVVDSVLRPACGMSESGLCSAIVAIQDSESVVQPWIIVVALFVGVISWWRTPNLERDVRDARV